MKKLLLLPIFTLTLGMNITYGSTQLLDNLSNIPSIEAFYTCLLPCTSNEDIQANLDAITSTCTCTQPSFITLGPRSSGFAGATTITTLPDAILSALNIPETTAQAQDIAARATVIYQLIDLLTNEQPTELGINAAQLAQWYITNIILPTYDAPSSTNSANLSKYKQDLTTYNNAYQNCVNASITVTTTSKPAQEAAIVNCEATVAQDAAPLTQDLKDLTSYLQAQQNTLQNTLVYLAQQGQNLDSASATIYTYIQQCPTSQDAVECLTWACNQAQNSPTTITPTVSTPSQPSNPTPPETSVPAPMINPAPTISKTFYLMQKPATYWSQKLPHGYTFCHLGNYQGHGICNKTQTHTCVHPFTPLTKKAAEKTCKYSAQTNEPNKKAITWSMPGLKTLPT